MTSDLLCDELVDYFNGLEDSPIVYAATKPAEVAEAEKESSDWKVFIVPFAESEEPMDRGDMCREEYQLSVVVNGPIRGGMTRESGFELCKFLRESLKETILLPDDPGDGYRWNGNETVSLYDESALKTKKQFLSLFRATYFRFA